MKQPNFSFMVLKNIKGGRIAGVIPWLSFKHHDVCCLESMQSSLRNTSELMGGNAVVLKKCTKLFRHALSEQFLELKIGIKILWCEIEAPAHFHFVST